MLFVVQIERCGGAHFGGAGRLPVRVEEHRHVARRDLEAYFERIAPEGAPYEHDDEGPDDMPAHLRSALTATQLSIPVRDGEPVLGTWQGIFLFEHRRNTPDREIVLHLIGE